MAVKTAKSYRPANPGDISNASPSLFWSNGYKFPWLYLSNQLPNVYQWDAISPDINGWGITKMIFGREDGTNTPIGRGINKLDSDTTFVTSYKWPLLSKQYKAVKKGEPGYQEYQELFKTTLKEQRGGTLNYFDYFK